MIDLEGVELGTELPELSRTVTAADVKAYAEAGGDQNPLHQDDAVARSAGFDGIIAHGMFTMGHMAAAVAAWAGEDAVVERIAAQFRAPVLIGEEIVAGGRVRAVAGDRVTLELWVRVRRGEATGWAIKKGEAVLRVG